MEYSGTCRVAVTYANDKFQDGAGAQLLRIYAIYALSRRFGVSYIHSPLAHIGYHGLSALEENAGPADAPNEYNRIFDIPSDVDLPEDVVTHTLQDADADYIENVKKLASADGLFHLIRIVLPFTVTDRDAGMYRCLSAVSPFTRDKSDVFRLAIHVRRGDLFAVDSDRMLPNSYYVTCARRFVKTLERLGIPFVCELYTEAASRKFEVTPHHHGINGRLAGNITIDPEMSRLEDFDAIPNLKRFINTDPIDSLRRMTTADGLILSRSCFSYLPALLSQSPIVLYNPFVHSPMKDWLITNDAGDFSEMDLIRSFERQQQNPGPDQMQSLLEVFHTQSVAIRSMDLLVISAESWDSAAASANDFPFRALAIVGDSSWRLRRTLFDAGFICIGSAPTAEGKALCFLASDAVRAFHLLNVEPRGHIAMSDLSHRAGFANQLFRYAFTKLYAMRHGLTAALPEWLGNSIFGLRDEPCAGLTLASASYPGFAENDREWWDQDDPPIDIDVSGYFQELPECWRKHRALLRRMFELPVDHSRAIDAWRDAVTEGGRRLLVAIHVRRADYRKVGSELPYFQMVPEDCYLEWLRDLWPTLRDPVLFVSTDEPETILPAFEEFAPLGAALGTGARSLPDHLRDFEIMRRADYLAICNSSFSRMASILALREQQCFIPSFVEGRFEPYEPWIDAEFWRRFKDGWVSQQAKQHESESSRGDDRRSHHSAEELMSDHQSEVPYEDELPTGVGAIFFDVSDLVTDLLHQSTLSGIQRVQSEILRLLPASPQPVRFVVLSRQTDLYMVDRAALLDAVERICSEAAPRKEIEQELRTLLARAAPCSIRPGDVFLEIGAFWNTAGVGALLQRLKSDGVRTAVFIHDVIPIAAPEYFGAASAALFTKAVYEALSFADFVLTASEFNRTCLLEHQPSGFDAPPIQLVPLGHEFSRALPEEPQVSETVAGILESEFVLSVGTIEVRKNPSYLLNMWKLLARSGRKNIPTLVLAGRKGWLVGDFLEQLQACNYLNGRIVLLHGATDVELSLLYQECLLTIFPSFMEGWGLPVGESLAHGKVCLCSEAGGVPEAGGKLADYIDPYNVRDGLEKLKQYLDDPALRRSRERQIAEGFEARSWQSVAAEFLESALELAQQAQPPERTPAISLPRDRFMAAGNDAPGLLPMDGIDGRLSAALACVAGWHAPEALGVRAAQPVAAIRFRADAPAGSRINLVLRLAAHGRDYLLSIRSGSGGETEVVVKDRSEKLAALSCSVEEDRLVTVRVSVIGANLTRERDHGYWLLKGILYFDPQAGDAAEPKAARRIEPPAAAEPEKPVSPVLRPERFLLRQMPNDALERAASCDAFAGTPNSYWTSGFVSNRDAPVFADDADRQSFYSGCGNGAQAPQVGRIADSVNLVRRGESYVSMSRFSEGCIFDRDGVWKSFGYLQGAPAAHTPWLSNAADGLWVTEKALAAAPYHDETYIVFYNGNLHNYYHWVIEGLLLLDILANTVGIDSGVKIALPKSMDIDALIPHRESLQAIGLGGFETVEVADNLIQVRDALWVHGDQVQSMPAPYLQDFNQRIAALYADKRTPRRRRLLVTRNWTTRTIHNLAEVEDLLTEFGFETVYLEGMSMREQILLFQSADFVIGPHGAGLSNLIFCRPGTTVIELSPSVEIRPFFWIISEKVGLRHALQFCDPVGDKGFQSAIHVDIGKLNRLARKLGVAG